MKKIFYPFLLVLMIFSVSSCNSQGKINITESDDPTENLPDNTNTTTPNDTPSEETGTKDEAKEPAYSLPNISIDETENPSVVTPVETTVEAVYDSVVSIDVRSTTVSGSGSGVLFAEDETLGLSFIVTCFHVIDDCPVITVTLTDGTVYSASLVGGYEDEDIAVLTIEATDLCYASFYENSDLLKLGSQVVCIGNPLGTLPGSISSGYLSYKNREIQVDSYRTMRLLQTDVAINSGNSGGGLFNTSGALIGIVNAKYADEDIEGLGFAIPINTVKAVIEDFISTAKYDTVNKVWDTGYVEGDWELGFTISDGRYGGWMGSYVIYISALSDNASASGSNIFQKEDIITGVKIDYFDDTKTDIDSVSISSASMLLKAIYSADLSLKDRIIFTITRNNSTQTVTVELIQFIYSV